MSQNDYYINVLGDSHTRSFCYNTFFFPICIGAGIDTCFLTKEKKNKTYAKLYESIKRLDLRKPIMLVLGEPDIRHHLENRFNTHQLYKSYSNEEVIKKAALNYVDVIKKIKSEFDFKLIIYNSVPTERLNHNKLARLYNNVLEQYCLKAQDTFFINIWDDLIDKKSGIVKNYYKADFVHLNEKVDKIVIAKIKSLLKGALFESHYSKYFWNYFYKYTINGNTIGIWGDIPARELIIAKGEKKKRFDKSKAVYWNVFYFLLYLRMHYLASSKKMIYLVDNAREGYINHILAGFSITNVKNIEKNEDNIQASNRLNFFLRKRKIEYCSNREFSDVSFTTIKSINSTHEITNLMNNTRKEVFAIISKTILDDVVSLFLQNGYKKRELPLMRNFFEDNIEYHSLVLSKKNSSIRWALYKGISFLFLSLFKVLKVDIVKIFFHRPILNIKNE